MVGPMEKTRIRLYVDRPLGPGQTVPLTPDQSRYLFGTMRLGTEATVLLFNGTDDEHLAHVSEIGRRGGTLVCAEPTGSLRMPPDLWVLFAPVKKSRTDFIVEKAVEMGAARICPVLTEFTNSGRVRCNRLRAHAVEAAEQCGATFVPDVVEAGKLADVLMDWPTDRQLMFCDETLRGDTPGTRVFPSRDEVCGSRRTVPWAILVGPEGGFSDAERTRLHTLPFTRAASLGPRVLRTETAVVAAMTVWQLELGDWGG